MCKLAEIEQLLQNKNLRYMYAQCRQILQHPAVADPGFPRGGHLGGRQHTILPNFPKKCMKFKEFGPPEGAQLLRALLHPPMPCVLRDEFKGNNYFSGRSRISQTGGANLLFGNNFQKSA